MEVRELVDKADIIAFEGLQITNMVSNHHLFKIQIHNGCLLGQSHPTTAYKAETAKEYMNVLPVGFALIGTPTLRSTS